jgi:hypothetical protein
LEIERGQKAQIMSGVAGSEVGVTSAHIVTLVAVPGEASYTDAPEQLSDDDGVPLS